MMTLTILYIYAEAVKEFIDSMSDNDHRDELSLIKQESADYDLINDVKSKPEHLSLIHI